MTPDQIRARFPFASESFIRKNLAAEPEAKGKTTVLGKSPIRQRKGTASKLQLAFLGFLKASPVGQNEGVYILDEAITLKLGNGVTYRPDVWAVIESEHGVRLFAYEVKGPHFWAAAKVKLKVAPSVFPWIAFYLVTRPERHGPWKIEQILP